MPLEGAISADGDKEAGGDVADEGELEGERGDEQEAAGPALLQEVLDGVHGVLVPSRVRQVPELEAYHPLPTHGMDLVHRLRQVPELEAYHPLPTHGTDLVHRLRQVPELEQLGQLGEPQQPQRLDHLEEPNLAAAAA